MWVFAAGMPRSASTLQYQIAKELIKRNELGCDFGWVNPKEHGTLKAQCNHPSDLCLLKSHSITDFIHEKMSRHNAIALYSHRCILDVVSSLKHKNNTTYTNERLRNLVLSIKKTHEQWLQWDNVIVQKYEDLVDQLEECANEIAVAMKIDIDCSHMKEIVDALRIEKQTAYIEKLHGADNLVKVDQHNEYDPESLLHLNHISGGLVGRYVENLTHSEIETIRSVWPDGVRSL